MDNNQKWTRQSKRPEKWSDDYYISDCYGDYTDCNGIV